MTLNEYSQEVANYLYNKVPDINPATICEIAEFFVMKSNNFAHDMVAENNKAWKKEFDRHNKQWERFVAKSCNQ